MTKFASNCKETLRGVESPYQGLETRDLSMGPLHIELTLRLQWSMVNSTQRFVVDKGS